MTKQEMIDVIYEKVADKTLSFGCKIKLIFKNGKYGEYIIAQNGEYVKGVVQVNTYKGFELSRLDEEYETKKMEIIGHPVMIGDVLDWIEKNTSYDYDVGGFECKNSDYFGNLFKLWDYKRQLIENQSELCIQYIYNLIK